MKLTFGQRAADVVANFGGSWAFIILLATIFASWIIFNTFVIINVFDPYPYILLNLFLSMLATIQVPFILMSQNRQEQRDRVKAEHSYKINAKAELEIISLHEKIDLLREQDWNKLLEIQAEQLKLLEKLIRK